MSERSRRAAAVAPILALAGLLVTAAAFGARKPPAPEELFNPLLGVDWSHWMVGPISWIATKKEIEEYLMLVTDEEAAAFAEGFWAERAKGTGPFEKTPEQLYGERVETADSRYSEGTWPGRRTDRGTVFVVYGEPEKIEFESGQEVGDPPLEVWKYGKDAAKGLDGEKPEKEYRFYQRTDGKTVFWDSRARLDPRERMRRRDDRLRRNGFN